MNSILQKKLEEHKSVLLLGKDLNEEIDFCLAKQITPTLYVTSQEELTKYKTKYEDNINCVDWETLRKVAISGKKFSISYIKNYIETDLYLFQTLSLVKNIIDQEGFIIIDTKKFTQGPVKEDWLGEKLVINKVVSYYFSIQNQQENNEDVSYLLKNDRPKIVDQQTVTLLQKAKTLVENKDYQAAKEIYLLIIKKIPMISDGYNGLAVCEKYLKTEMVKVVNIFLNALKLDPANANIYNNLGDYYVIKNEYQLAKQTYVDCLTIDENNITVLNELSLLLEKEDNLEQALNLYNKALKLDPMSIKTNNNLGIFYYNLRRYDKAVEHFTKVVQKDPDFLTIYGNLGAALNKNGQQQEAIKYLKKGIELNPNNPGAYTNLGNVYNKLHNYKEGETCHKKSIELDPDGVNAYANLGTSLKNQGKIQEAEKNYRKAISMNDDFENAHFDLASLLLSQKKFKEGFKEYEWRFKKSEMKGHIRKHKDVFSTPRFSEENNKEGIRVLLHTEQGFGDAIMFGKFLPEFRKKFKNVHIILQCRDELRTIFEESFKNEVDEFYSRDSEKLPQFDYQYPAVSLPYLLEIKTEKEFPKQSKFLKAVKDETIEIKKEKGKINIGIAWSASVTSDSYEERKYDLKLLNDLIKSDKVNVYNLQVGEESKDIKECGYENDIIDITDKLKSFNDTANFIPQLDLIISSDTSLVHLAGALNVPTWVAIPKYCDWRWGLKGGTTYWYDSVKLYRQTTHMNWTNVFKDIIKDLDRKFKLNINKNNSSKKKKKRK